MTGSTEIIVLGAKGRMGQMILQAAARVGAVKVVGAVERKGADGVGHPTGVAGIDVTITDNLAGILSHGRTIIDFTSPESTVKNVELAASAGAGIVIGTTGLSSSQKEQIHSASNSIPVLLSPNMSLGVNISFKISEMVAAALQGDFDVEIIEAHHHHKKDAPSGTALGLAEAVARGHQVSLQDKAIYGREGFTGERTHGEIGIHAVRAGDIAGDHTVLFAGDGERIEIKHMAHNRTPFANGAVKAAQYLAGQSPGFYTMADVLGLK